LSEITLLLLGAGSSSRFDLPVKKQWLWIGEDPLWLFVAKRFESMGFSKILITAAKEEKPFFERYCHYPILEGGDSRQESVQKALEFIKTPFVMVSDIARVCIPQKIVKELVSKKEEADCVAPAITPPDTVVYQNETIDRSQVLLVQTPQIVRTELLKEALKKGKFTDESSAIRALGKKVLYIQGSEEARKLTYKEDLPYLPCLIPPSAKRRTGFGMDVHAFCEGRPLKLCGVEIPHTHGLAGHSDADVAIHAIIDALLGAAGFGDIGELFPDSDSSYENIDSTLLLRHTAQLLQKCGFVIEHVDLTIAAQAPKLLDFKPLMQKQIAKILKLPLHACNVKATTTERLGFVGRKEGILAMANATLKYYDWSGK
jgi:2-C-methyl-D-erythritol 4-phosphate cytidylyltransferase/2-C-methyl-D-erythritol 2,4-cyclodiphosphate synthase